MPAGNSHRILKSLYEAFTRSIGPGILRDPGNAGVIRPDMNFQVCEMVSTGSETRTLANPDRVGIRFLLRMLTDGGDIVVTASNGLNPEGDTVSRFADAGDSLSLVSVTLSASSGTFRWDVQEGNVGAPISSTSPSSSISSSPSAT
jgi:hypothetical protein